LRSPPWSAFDNGEKETAIDCTTAICGRSTTYFPQSIGVTATGDGIDVAGLRG
jgi:hypothetical protein